MIHSLSILKQRIISVQHDQRRGLNSNLTWVFCELSGASGELIKDKTSGLPLLCLPCSHIWYSMYSTFKRGAKEARDDLAIADLDSLHVEVEETHAHTWSESVGQTGAGGSWIYAAVRLACLWLTQAVVIIPSLLPCFPRCLNYSISWLHDSFQEPSRSEAPPQCKCFSFAPFPTVRAQ